MRGRSINWLCVVRPLFLAVEGLTTNMGMRKGFSAALWPWGESVDGQRVGYSEAIISPPLAAAEIFGWRDRQVPTLPTSLRITL
ncbi:hypothetical protein XENTR_v10020233 [Xenopus tropicalis]|nr:hypothetical protein XENTR_v10020233 [Xenopus tropicalis]